MSKTEWLFGFHSIESRISHAPESIIEVFLDESRRDARMQKLIKSLKAHGMDYQSASKRALAKMVDANHQGVVCKALGAEQQAENELFSLLESLAHPPLLLILDQITDPHNLGACLRTADGAGVDAVVLPKDGSCPITQTVRHVASGAAESVNIFYVSNLARALNQLKQQGLWLIGLADDADQGFKQAKITRPVALILGAESKGMRKLTRSHCDQLISIPMQGTVPSLNVSVATAIVLFSVDD